MKTLDYTKEIKRKIKKHNTIFIVGHKNLDLDAIGSSLGVYSIVKNFHKNAYIIVDDEIPELGVKKLIDDQKDIKFIKSKDVDNLKTNSNLLIIVDTNKSTLLSSENLIDKFDEIIIIDHHQINEKTINKGLRIIDD